MNKITVGIDLGTDKCCITYQDNIGRPFIIIDEDSYKISSIIGIMNDGLLVGNEISKNNIYDIPIITNLKRLIGHNSTSIYAQTIAKHNGWLLTDIENDLLIGISGRTFSLNYLMCVLLNKLKDIIIKNIGEDFNAIITIPANFNEGQKNKILSYCKQVNIECLYLVYEPCSACLTYINYFYQKQNIIDDELNRIIVFDFGAGTLDLAIVSCNCIINDSSIEWMAKIESNIGDNNLGGIDIDIILKNYILDKFFKQTTIKDSINFLIEKIKIKLSKLTIDSKITIIERYYNQIISINIEEYYNLLDTNFKHRIINLLDQIHQNIITKTDIDNILLIGGSCYNPWIQNIIKEYYDKEIFEYKLDINNKSKIFNLDIKDIGVSLGATCYGKKNKTGSNLILTESLPLSIGIETVNNVMCKIIPKHTLIPCSVKKYFSTSEDFQKTIEIKMYQGERENTNDNYYLGSFKIVDLEPELSGKIVLIIDVSITTDGLIIVNGKIKNTDKYDRQLIINRYNYSITDKLIDYNIRQYEINDSVFNNIMVKYYELVTMLNKLQYNLLDNITIKIPREKIDEILLSFWDDLICVYRLMLESPKLKNNINQLTNFIEYIIDRLDYNIVDRLISNIDDKIISNKIDKLNKYIITNFQHMVTTYQIKSDTINNLKYDTIDENIKLEDIHSIMIDQTDIKNIKELLIMIADNCQTFDISDNNKLLLLEFIDKYDVYINQKIMENNINGEIDRLQKICQIIIDLTDNNLIVNLLKQINDVDINLIMNNLLTI